MKDQNENKKIVISITVDRNIHELIVKKFANKSKYIEWLIYQDLLKNSTNEKIKNILI